jgi:DnaK suppressor protein
MTHDELTRFHTALNEKQAELAQALRRRDGITIERAPDSLDQVQLAAERDLATRGLERETALLHNVRSALDRIADGSYGTCMECEEEIRPKRLQAMPWATLCIACQEHADRKDGSRGGRHELLLEAA